MNWELGEPLTYDDTRGRDNIPLALATIWPADLTDRAARQYAALVEHDGARLIGAVLCPVGDCGAAL